MSDGSRERPTEKEAPDREASGVPVLVSACLLGRQCRYDGSANEDRALERELEERGMRAMPFCPEEHGGLGTPRPAAWIEKESAAGVLDGRERVVTDARTDVSAQFIEGAEGALSMCRTHGIALAFLKERSPSCGVCQTHVGGRLADGPGVTTELLRRNGIEVRGIGGRRE